MTGFNVNHISRVISGRQSLSVNFALALEHAIPGMFAAELLAHENLYRLWLHHQLSDPTESVIRSKSADKRAEKARAGYVEIEIPKG